MVLGSNSSAILFSRAMVGFFFLLIIDVLMYKEEKKIEQRQQLTHSLTHSLSFRFELRFGVHFFFLLFFLFSMVHRARIIKEKRLFIYWSRLTLLILYAQMISTNVCKIQYEWDRKKCKKTHTPNCSAFFPLMPFLYIIISPPQPDPLYQIVCVNFPPPITIWSNAMQLPAFLVRFGLV